MPFRLSLRTNRRVLTPALMSLILVSLLPVSLHAARGANSGKMEVLPSQKAAPAAVYLDAQGTEADLRRQLRLKTGVVEIKADLMQIRFSLAPLGSFGFAPQQGLGLALVSQSPDMLLERTPPASNAYEIHKLADGSALVVGFVSADLKPLLSPQLRPKNIRLALHSNPTDKAPYIVGVPLSKLAVDQMPHRVDPKNPNSPVVLEMDLQSSSNRQAPHGAQ